VQFLLTILLQFYPCYYLAFSFNSCICWVPTTSVLNLAIFPCYSNLLVRRRRWTGILRWGVLGYVLPRLPLLWSYGVLRCSISLRVVIVFRDFTYIIIILYSWHLVICEHFWVVCVEQLPGSCIRWVLDFGIKTGMTVRHADNSFLFGLMGHLLSTLRFELWRTEATEWGRGWTGAESNSFARISLCPKFKPHGQNHAIRWWTHQQTA
jgi:hypothetical protein